MTPRSAPITITPRTSTVLLLRLPCSFAAAVLQEALIGRFDPYRNAQL